LIVLEPIVVNAVVVADVVPPISAGPIPTGAVSKAAWTITADARSVSAQAWAVAADSWPIRPHGSLETRGGLRHTNRRTITSDRAIAATNPGPISAADSGAVTTADRVAPDSRTYRPLESRRGFRHADRRPIPTGSRAVSTPGPWTIATAAGIRADTGPHRSHGSW